MASCLSTCIIVLVISMSVMVVFGTLMKLSNDNKIKLLNARNETNRDDYKLMMTVLKEFVDYIKTQFLS